MHNVQERERHTSPGGRPHPIVFHDKLLWVGSWDTNRVYAIDPHDWSLVDEVAAPGKPYGLASLRGEIRAVVSIGDDDDRYFYTLVPGRGFDAESKTACPDFTGSHVAFDGITLYLGQMTNRRILAMNTEGAILREIALPTRCTGFAFRDDTFYMISADDEFENLQLATLDVSQTQPTLEPVAGIPFDARSLAFDGHSWWTNHRESNDIVSFAV